MLRFPKGAILQPEQVIVIAQTAVGFRTLFGFNPDYEIQDSDAAVPDILTKPKTFWVFIFTSCVQ